MTVYMTALSPETRKEIICALEKDEIFEELFPRLGRTPRRYGDLHDSVRALVNRHEEMLRMKIHIVIE
jgi:hypothetical protein